MTLTTAVLSLAAPALTTALTGALKGLPAFAELAASRKPVIRFLAACLAFVSVLLLEWIAGAFDPDIIAAAFQTLTLTFLTWVASLGIFHGLFEKPALPSYSPPAS